MAALCETHAGLEPASVVRAATQGGASALGLADSLGSIEAGKSDRLTVVPFRGDGDPYEYLCDRPGAVFPLRDAPYETRA